VRILFVGNEEEYTASIQTRGNDRPFSLFFCNSFSDALEPAGFDAVVVPALRFLAYPPLTRQLPLIASGTARLAESCFEAGCSDFIREPWTEDELHARIASHTRTCLAFNDDGLILTGHSLIGPAAEIQLSDAAYSILLLLANNIGQAVPRMAIASLVGDHTNSSRSIDMRIARLRAALRSAGAGTVADRLRCTHGAYRLDV